MSRQHMYLMNGPEELIECFMDTGKDYQKGFGYIYDGYIYIYKGKLKKNQKAEPGSIYLSSGNIIRTEPKNKDARHVSQLKICNTKTAIDAAINGNVKEVDQDLKDATSKVYAPPVKEDDDILKILIKLALQDMQTNPVSDDLNSYDITNLKSGLSRPGNLSFKYFQKWVEILGCTVDITINYRDKDGDLASKTRSL